MTPMREAFVKALALVEHSPPAQHRALVNACLMQVMDRARDAEEAGAAAQFAAAALLYLDAVDNKVVADVEARRMEFEVQTQILASVMLLRRGKVKDASTSLCLALA